MTNISIVEAATPAQLDQVAALLRDYLLWMRRRYQGRQGVIDGRFDKNEWDSELADLAGHYGAPFGAILLGFVDGIPAGCVMMRSIGEKVCEMKRLFVRPAFQGLGLGRNMVTTLGVLACERGYPNMRLETGPLQAEAQALYGAMGFKSIGPYYARPESIVKDGCFFEKNTCPPAPVRSAA